MPPSPLASRFAVAIYDDGAVLLDLRSGTFFRLNRSAARICQGLADDKSPDELTEHLAQESALPPSVARRHVESVLYQIGTLPPRKRQNPVTFQVAAGGYVFYYEGRPVWHIGANGQTLKYLADSSSAQLDPKTQLLWVAPHLLRLRNILVLHASAVATNQGVLAFSGASGLGKTTLVRLLVGRGLGPIAEDLLVVPFRHEQAEAALHGERAIHRWAEQHAGDLRPFGEVPTDELGQILAGGRLPLERILFLQRAPTAAAEVRELPLGRAHALIGLLENSFAELDQPDLWRRLWEENCRLVASVAIGQVEVPDQLELLEAAAASYSLRLKAK